MGLKTGSLHIAWEHVRKANSQVLPQTYRLRICGNGAQGSVIYKPSRWFWGLLTFEEQEQLLGLLRELKEEIVIINTSTRRGGELAELTSGPLRRSCFLVVGIWVQRSFSRGLGSTPLKMGHSLERVLLSLGVREIVGLALQVLGELQTDLQLLQEGTATSTAKVKKQGWPDAHRSCKPSLFRLP